VVLGLFRPKPVSPRLERLHSLFLFVNLTPAELAIVDGLLHERDYLADEVIFDEGEDGQAIYIVLEGKVSIRRDIEGKPLVLAEMETGAVFGDVALLNNAPRLAQARAAGPCRLAVFFREDFMSLLDTHARIASKISLQIARTLANRLRDVRIVPQTSQHL
jgi:CRP/FNR family transcriptional regulator, cyclic AMP receptor protein